MKNFINLKQLEHIINIGFFTSKGGVSTKNYYSLNCSKNNDDTKSNVNKNIKIALSNLNLENKKFKLVNQIHSKNIIEINKENFKRKFYGDGLITIDKNIALGVLTADCAPIFLFDKEKKIICSIHSGWKGAFLNITKEAVKKISRKKINIKNLIAVVGPCLGFENFEVDKNFKIKFLKKNKYYSKFFSHKNENKDLFNLRNLINFQLKKEGIQKIYHIRKNTYKYSDYFFSHRRAIHENKVMTGRMINIISFRD